MLYALALDMGRRGQPLDLSTLGHLAEVILSERLGPAESVRMGGHWAKRFVDRQQKRRSVQTGGGSVPSAAEVQQRRVEEQREELERDAQPRQVEEQRGDLERDAQPRQGRPPTCTRCGRVGHNRRQVLQCPGEVNSE